MNKDTDEITHRHSKPTFQLLTLSEKRPQEVTKGNAIDPEDFAVRGETSNDRKKELVMDEGPAVSCDTIIPPPSSRYSHNMGHHAPLDWPGDSMLA